MSSGRFQHTLTFVTVIALWVSYGKYLFYLFENSRFFSHLSDTEREMTYRTEMGLYFSFYKALVSSNVTDWKSLLLRDNLTEYGHSINTLQRFNLYSEVSSDWDKLFPVLLALAYKSYKKAANYFDLNDQECWRINRGADLPPILSCEGIGNAHYFYVYMVFGVAGTVLPSVFICGTFFSGYIGGLVSTSAFFFNQGEATRVQWTPPLRESFAYPMFMAQTVVLTHILQCGRVSHFMAFAFTFFATAFCVFWQLSPFIIGTQLGSLFFLYSLRLVPFPLFSSLWRLFSLSFLLSLAFLFGNLMLLNSLFFTSLFSIKMILLLRPFLRFPTLPLFFSLHLMLYLTGTFGIKFFLQSLFNITSDNHISDLVVAKFTGSHNFHTRLYTCAPEFDFLGFETIRKLINSWLLPISFFAILLLIIKLTRTAIQLRKWKKIPADSCHVKMHVEKLYNIVQLGCFVAMALLVMRLKLFATPHLCLLCSWAVNKDLLGTRLAPFRGILAVLLFSGMASQGWVNVSEQLEIKGEYNNPEQERLFHWIDKNTREDAVFAGTMALMANVKLSTLRPIFNHPHYESEEVRNRTLLVYSVYSRKSLSEVYRSLRSSGINYYVFQPQQCLEKHPKDGCSYLEMWDEHDPSNKGRPSLCHRIWEARKSGEQLGSFRPVYWSSSYIVLAL